MNNGIYITSLIPKTTLFKLHVSSIHKSWSTVKNSFNLQFRRLALEDNFGPVQWGDSCLGYGSS